MIVRKTDQGSTWERLFSGHVAQVRLFEEAWWYRLPESNTKWQGAYETQAEAFEAARKSIEECDD
jgi:hypothetical protein